MTKQSFKNYLFRGFLVGSNGMRECQLSPYGRIMVQKFIKWPKSITSTTATVARPNIIIILLIIMVSQLLIISNVDGDSSLQTQNKFPLCVCVMKNCYLDHNNKRFSRRKKRMDSLSLFGMTNYYVFIYIVSFILLTLLREWDIFLLFSFVIFKSEKKRKWECFPNSFCWRIDVESNLWHLSFFFALSFLIRSCCITEKYRQLSHIITISSSLSKKTRQTSTAVHT